MFARSPLCPVRPFYPMGNTPAVSLTATVPHGQDADVLLLGCCDVRHILYTCFTDRGLPPRKLDITTCNTDQNIIARNILVLTLILDGAEAASPEQIWSIYYHLYLDDSEMQLLRSQTEKLLGLSETLDAWHTATYGSALRFCDEGTFRLVRSVWESYAASVEAKNTAEYRSRFESARKSSQKLKKMILGEKWLVPEFARALGLYFLLQRSEHEGIEATRRFWETGMSTIKPPGTNLSPNPLFAVAISEIRPLAYPSDPLLSFHLAIAYAKLTELSPLRLDNPEEPTLAAAQLLFREWTGAFRDAVARLVVRFVVSDCFSLCHTLKHNAETGEVLAYWYRHESGFDVLELASTEYGEGGKAPRLFDVIDTLTIYDDSSALNSLVSAGPLLKDKPWATIHTELVMMTSGNGREASGNGREAFESLLYGHTRTISMLCGLAPVEYWTNATAISKFDEILLGLLEDANPDELYVQSRLAWKRDKYLAREGPAMRKVTMKPADLAMLAHRVYLDMFRYESPAIGDPPRQAPLHQGTFAAFVNAICTVTLTNPTEVGRLLVEKMKNEEILGSNYSHSLILELTALGIYSDPALEGKLYVSNYLSWFWTWRHIPDRFAVTIVIPTAQWQKAYRIARDLYTGLPLEGAIHCEKEDGGGYRDAFPDVQVSFGTVTTKGSRYDEDFSIFVEEDPDGWAGDSPMIATFWALTGLLQLNIPDATVMLRLKPLPEIVNFFSKSLGGLYLCRAELHDDTQVLISQHAPGHTGYRVVGSGALPILSCLENLSISTPSPVAGFTVEIDPQAGDISAVTGHIDITTDEGKKLLTDKVPIELQQSSPFTIDIVFGKRSLVVPMTFPIPVSKESSKTRVARKSCYIEVIAPVATHHNSTCLEDFIFPTVLSPHGAVSALNIPHTNLGTLPILAIDGKENKRFMQILPTLMFSARERPLRQLVDQTTALSTSARQNFKESLYTMMAVSSGLQGGQTGLFGLSDLRDRIHMRLFVSALCLDGAAASIVLDAAVLPITMDMADKPEMAEFLLLLRAFEGGELRVDDAELRLWKRVLPAFAERCRTWEHTTTCEYLSAGRVPVSEDVGGQILCSCGQGRFPDQYLSLPGWDTLSQFATRVAISPVFASPFIEDVIPSDWRQPLAEKRQALAAGGSSKFNLDFLFAEGCRACGQPHGENGGALKKCKRCLAVMYCSAECQKKDWKMHKMECKEADVYASK
ncbi:MYND finger [Echria macrotheca]|uniref:MYND finger n=1 Tax=Echria macrotheca TaxID=438768 RepID=A0AAJ0B7H3_9PEZI|nr:MYND finger [Echria macrotheca]